MPSCKLQDKEANWYGDNGNKCADYYMITALIMIMIIIIIVI